jgi:hypothetical protein
MLAGFVSYEQTSRCLQCPSANFAGSIRIETRARTGQIWTGTKQMFLGRARLRMLRLAREGQCFYGGVRSGNSVQLVAWYCRTWRSCH